MKVILLFLYVFIQSASVDAQFGFGGLPKPNVGEVSSNVPRLDGLANSAVNAAVSGNVF